MNFITKQLLVIFLLISCFSFSQTQKDFLGAIKLYDTSLISYKLHISESKGKISGFSITDIGGKYETKSNISGTYDAKSGDFIFKEEGIVYTKTKVTQYDFCFVNFKGKMAKVNKMNTIRGKFKGVYSDGKECVNGEISLTNLDKIAKQAVKLDRKISKTKLVSEDKKKQVHVVKSLDTLNMNVLRVNQNMSLFTTRKTIDLEIYDSGQEDGDKITVLANNQKILSQYAVTKAAKKISIPCDRAETEIEISADSEGRLAPNTAEIRVYDGENEIKTMTNLKKGQKTQITVINKSYKK